MHPSVQTGSPSGRGPSPTRQSSVSHRAELPASFRRCAAHRGTEAGGISIWSARGAGRRTGTGGAAPGIRHPRPSSVGGPAGKFPSVWSFPGLGFHADDAGRATPERRQRPASASSARDAYRSGNQTSFSSRGKGTGASPARILDWPVRPGCEPLAVAADDMHQHRPPATSVAAAGRGVTSDHGSSLAVSGSSCGGVAVLRGFVYLSSSGKQFIRSDAKESSGCLMQLRQITVFAS